MVYSLQQTTYFSHPISGQDDKFENGLEIIKGYSWNVEDPKTMEDPKMTMLKGICYVTKMIIDDS